MKQMKFAEEERQKFNRAENFSENRFLKKN